MRIRGHSPRTISYGRPKLPVIPGREGVEALPYGGRGRYRRANRRRPSSGVGASGTPPLTGGLVTLRCGTQRKGTARAPFFTGAPALFIYPTPGGRGSPPLRRVGKISASHPRCPQPLSHAASRRDSSPFRGADRAGCGAPPSSISLTSPATPQSRRKAPRQLPFQGSRGVGGVFRPCAYNSAPSGFGLSLAAEGGLWYNTRRERDLLVQDL